MPARREILESLRAAMAAAGVDGYVVPSTDEHLNEYLPPEAERRAFVTGFEGSAGDLLVTADEAWLFTDSRYHLRADRDLEGTGITNVKMGVGDAPLLSELVQRLAEKHEGFRLGISGTVTPMATAERLESNLRSRAGQLVPLDRHLVDAIWKDRPSPARGPLLEIPGKPVAEKVQAVRERLARSRTEHLLIVKVDQIAWLTNLRGRVEVPYNPVFPSFAHVGPDGLHLFLADADARLPSGWCEANPGVQLHDPETWVDHLSALDGPISLDPSAVTFATYEALSKGRITVKEELSPIESLKAAKTPEEAEAMRVANFHASVAKTRALLWLRAKIAAGHAVTEKSFATRLEELYAQAPDFHSLSFNTISATGANSADVHYSDCAEIPLEDGHLFLIDSGAHCAGGTTDDTRTVAIGPATQEMRTLYTLVLKGHVAAARQRMPGGTHGAALDAHARAPLWNAGLDFGHGTGHGVGAFLNVHEGPFSISSCRRLSSAHAIPAGAVFSIEPGYYRTGYGGIRLENLYLAGETLGADGRSWLELESLTWIPFEPRLIDDSMLSAEESAWLADYHATCRERLLPHLDQDEARALESWLAGD